MSGRKGERKGGRVERRKRANIRNQPNSEDEEEDSSPRKRPREMLDWRPRAPLDIDWLTLGDGAMTRSRIRQLTTIPSLEQNFQPQLSCETDVTENCSKSEDFEEGAKKSPLVELNRRSPDVEDNTDIISFLCNRIKKVLDIYNWNVNNKTPQVDVSRLSPDLKDLGINPDELKKRAGTFGNLTERTINNISPPAKECRRSPDPQVFGIDYEDLELFLNHQEQVDAVKNCHFKEATNNHPEVTGSSSDSEDIHERNKTIEAIAKWLPLPRSVPFGCESTTMGKKIPLIESETEESSSKEANNNLLKVNEVTVRLPNSVVPSINQDVEETRTKSNADAPSDGDQSISPSIDFMDIKDISVDSENPYFSKGDQSISSSIDFMDIKDISVDSENPYFSKEDELDQALDSGTVHEEGAASVEVTKTGVDMEGNPYFDMKPDAIKKRKDTLRGLLNTPVHAFIGFDSLARQCQQENEVKFLNDLTNAGMLQNLRTPFARFLARAHEVIEASQMTGENVICAPVDSPVKILSSAFQSVVEEAKAHRLQRNS